MAAQQITQRDTFECAYLVADTIFRCINYKIEVTAVRNNPDSQDMVVEFEYLKRIIHKCLPDRSFLYDASVLSDPIKVKRPSVELAETMQRLNLSTHPCYFCITAENICGWLASVIQRAINELNIDITIVEVKLRETADSYVTWSYQ